jgi:hypothetical protein
MSRAANQHRFCDFGSSRSETLLKHQPLPRSFPTSRAGHFFIKVLGILMADRNLDHLYPPFRARVDAVLAGLQAWCKVHAPKWEVKVIEGYRPQSRQDELYAQGRTKPGFIVTKTRNSRHTDCLAVDLVPFVDGKPNWEASEAFWLYYGHLCRLNKITWGGDWNSDGKLDPFRDNPHCEWSKFDLITRAKARAWRDKQEWRG